MAAHRSRLTNLVLDPLVVGPLGQVPDGTGWPRAVEVELSSHDVVLKDLEVHGLVQPVVGVQLKVREVACLLNPRQVVALDGRQPEPLPIERVYPTTQGAAR